MNFRNIKRINVVGTSGSGKTTLSRTLAELLDVLYIEMDGLFWGPNWSSSSDDVLFTKLQAALDRDAWVLDGNYTRTIPIKWANVDCVVWLDYSFARTLGQAVRRAMKRSITREELWAGTGNRESFQKSFLSNDSIVLWTIRTHGSTRRRYEALMSDEAYDRIAFVRLRSPRQTERFLNQIRADRPTR